MSSILYRLKDIVCNISAFKCLNITRPLLYILFSCVFKSSKMFPSMFKLRKIHHFIQGYSVFHLVTCRFNEDENSHDLTSQCHQSSYSVLNLKPLAAEIAYCAFNWKPASQRKGMEFEMPVREGQIKDTTELHYGVCIIQCFWSFTHTKSQDVFSCISTFINFDHYFLNLFLWVPPTLWSCHRKSLDYPSKCFAWGHFHGSWEHNMSTRFRAFESHHLPFTNWFL